MPIFGRINPGIPLESIPPAIKVLNMNEREHIEIQFALADRELAAATWDALDSKAGVLIALSAALISVATFIENELERDAIFIGAGVSLILMAVSLAPYGFEYLEAAKYARCAKHAPDAELAEITRLYIEDRDEKLHERNRLKKNLVYSAVLILATSSLFTAIAGILQQK